MADNRDDKFRVRTGRSRSGGRQGSARPQSFIARSILRFEKRAGTLIRLVSLQPRGVAALTPVVAAGRLLERLQKVVAGAGIAVALRFVREGLSSKRGW